jgi:hypothetical protein
VQFHGWAELPPTVVSSGLLSPVGLTLFMPWAASPEFAPNISTGQHELLTEAVAKVAVAG